MAKGKIICIDGTDGCGKQTQTTLLYEYLKSKGFKVYRKSFPNYESRSSEPVKMYLAGEFGDGANCLDAYQASALYAVDRLCTYQSELKQHYENGEIIILDRYVSANMLHQACKIQDLRERDRFLDWLNAFEFRTLKLPKPDVVIFLDVPVETSKKLADSRETLKNNEKQDIHEKDFEHLRMAYSSGKYVAQKYGWSTIKCTDNIGNLLSIPEIHGKILQEVSKLNVINLDSEQIL